MKSIAVFVTALLVSPGATQAQTPAPADCPPAVTISAGTAPKDAAALLRLGDLYYKGGAVPRDYAKALAYYELAMKTGSATAKVQVGQMVALGIGVPQDVQRGRDILKEAAAEGNARAQLALGDLAATGKAGFMNPAEAIASYTAAADAGNSWAMIKLADIYRYGRFARPSPRKAAALYKRAADAGNAYGELGLGSMNLERQGGSPAAGRRLLASASSQGIEDADVKIAESYFTGRGNPRSSKKAVAYLRQEADKGNKAAALALIAAYRDGKIERNRRIFPRNLKLSNQALDTYKSLFTSDEQVQQAYLLTLAAAQPDSFERLYLQLADFPVDVRQSLVRQSREANQQFYLYAARKKLAELGIYKDKGKSTRPLFRAMSSYCRRVATPAFCQQPPTSGYYGEILSYAFRDPPVKAEDCPVLNDILYQVE
ncbi:MAG: tetratricopeptide repeat protein [Hyphomicrobiales bacterium]